MRASTSRADIDELLRRHAVRVIRYLRYLGCSPDEAEDLFHDVMLGALERPIEDRGEAAVASYLRLAAKHRFLATRRTGRSNAGLDDVEAADQAWTEMCGEDDGESRLEALRTCLEEVSDRGRRALELQYKDGLGRSRIAALLEVSEEGAKTLLRRTKDLLRACIERRLGR